MRVVFRVRKNGESQGKAAIFAISTTHHWPQNSDDYTYRSPGVKLIYYVKF